MKLVIASLNANTGYYRVIEADTHEQNIMQYMPPGSPKLENHIDELTESGEDGNVERIARAALFEEQGAYFLLKSSEHPIDRTKFRGEFFLTNEITIISESVPTIEVQLVKNYPYYIGLQLHNPDKIGDIFQGIEAYFSCKSHDRCFFVLSDDDNELLSDMYIKIASPSFKKPEVMLGKFSARYVRTCSNELVIGRLINNGNSFTVALSSLQGIKIPTCDIQFPTEEQLPIWERKESIAREITVHDRLVAILDNITQDPLGYDIYWMRKRLGGQSDFNPFKLSVSCPDYWDIDATDCNKVTYLPVTKVASTLEKGQDPWTSTSRVSVSWSRLLSNLFIPDIYNARQIEITHTLLTAACRQVFGPEEDKPELTLVSGSDIAKYYNSNMYAPPRQGELWSSCMRNVSASYFGLYVENPEKVNLLISRDRTSGLIHGRALVWIHNNKRYLDRVYSTSSIEQKRMQQWAAGQGMEDIWNGRRGGSSIKVGIPLQMPYHSQYPYMDSMAHLDPQTGILRNFYEKNTVEMRSTGGERPSFLDETTCYVTGRKAPKSKMVTTIDKKLALEMFLKKLKNGGYETENNVVQDELTGGFISKRQVAKLKIGNKSVVTQQSNPDICWCVTTNSYESSAKCAFSILDKGFILKSSAELMTDGTYCSHEVANKYKAILQHKASNKALALKKNELQPIVVA